MTAPTRWLLEDSPALIAVLDQALVCRDCSRSWRRRLGLADGEEIHVPLEVLLPGDENQVARQRLAAIARGGAAVSDRPVFLSEGEGRLAAWGAQEEAGSSARCVVVVVVTSDTGALEQATQDLLRVESEHQLILSAAGEGIYGLDAQGRMTFGNAATREILGWEVDEVLGLRAHDVHHHSHADGSPYAHTDCPIYAALKDGEVHRVDDEVFWRTDGSPVPVEYTSTPIIRDGKPDGAVVVFRDVSRRKKIEAEREAAYAQVAALKEQLEQERDYLRDEVEVKLNFGEIIGESPALKRTLAGIEAVADTHANVLILGESGVGKEMIARALHASSSRREKPLIKVNCASIPQELFESEFFGHVKGAFTGAHRDRVGRMQLAHEGTLFLDEVGEIPLSLQGKLLRALQEFEFERVGDDQTQRVDVRVVAATNRDLQVEVAEGRFREDLYYRLSVFPIELAPLRERRQDIVPLAIHFLDQICAELGRPRPVLSKQHGALLTQHPWPGNVRELKNVIERAVILTGGSRLRLDLALGAGTVDAPPSAPSTAASPGGYLTEAEFREKERQNLLAALEVADWRVWGPDGAAALLGLKPSTLKYRMDAFGLSRPGKR